MTNLMETTDDELIKYITSMVNKVDHVVEVLKRFPLFSNFSIGDLKGVSKGLTTKVLDHYKDKEMAFCEEFNNKLITDHLDNIWKTDLKVKNATNVYGTIEPLKLAMVKKLTHTNDHIGLKRMYQVHRVGYEDRLISQLLSLYSKMKERSLVYLCDSYLTEGEDGVVKVNGIPCISILEKKTAFIMRELKKAGKHNRGVCFESSSSEPMKALREISHCFGMDDDPSIKVIDNENVKITIYEYNTESG
jgi:hypothetical protein